MKIDEDGYLLDSFGEPVAVKTPLRDGFMLHELPDVLPNGAHVIVGAVRGHQPLTEEQYRYEERRRINQDYVDALFAAYRRSPR